MAPWMYNGSNFERQRSATGATGTTGTGVLASGIMGWDGTNYRRLLSSTAGVLSVAPAGFGTVNTNKATVTTAGTRVQLGANAASVVIVRAKPGNTGLIYVGGSGVTAANGYDLSPGGEVTLNVSNTNLIYVDAATNGDGVSYIWTT